MMHTLWQEFLTIVREEVGSSVVETWFKAVHCLRWDSHHKIVYLIAPNQFAKEWISQHYHDVFVKHLARLLNERQVSIVFTDMPKPSHDDSFIKPAVVAPQPKNVFTAAKPLRASTAVAVAPVQQGIRSRSGLNATFVFDSFVVGPSNKLAFAAAVAVSEKPGRLYNPLFIYGPSGLGKTHLLHAIGNAIKGSQPKCHVLYQSAERFVQEFINAIRFDRVYQFESKYKDVDVLLVDDIQSISNKEQTQEAFFHIFNVLHQAHKQIVFTSDSMPRDIEGLAQRMRSRLEGGLIVDIQIPTLETKVAILKKKAALNHDELPDDVAIAIAERQYQNIRELEGALIRVLAHSTLTSEELSVELVDRVLQKTKPTQSVSLELATIAEAVVRHSGFSLAELRSEKRDKELAGARHIAMFLMKKHTSFSLKEIGVFFARRDHTTVLHAYEKISTLSKTEHDVSEKIHVIERDFLSFIPT